MAPCADQTAATRSRKRMSGGLVRVQLALHPHLARVSVERPCRLLLCTDGLTNYVPEASITRALAQNHPRVAVDALIGMALAAGSPDNVTVIVLDVAAR